MNYDTIDDYMTKEFPSKYLKGDDLQGQEVSVTIDRIETDTIFNPQNNERNNRLVMYFEGKDKGLILGKERASELKELYGNLSPSDYKGKEVKLYAVPKGRNKIIHLKSPDSFSGEETIDLEELDASIT